MRRSNARLAGALLGCLLASSARADEAKKVDQVITAGVLAALDGDGKTAVRELSQAGLMAPDRPELQDVLALAALTAGDRSRAIRLFAEHASDPARRDLAVYHAMAVSEGPGGAGRAREILAGRAKDADAPASVLFLAALAFANAGDDARAHELLERAIDGAKSALDPAFAPDPGAAMAERAVVVLEAIAAPPERALEIGKKLAETGRRQAASNIADRLADRSDAKAAARRLRATVLEKSAPRRALEELETLSKDSSDVRGVDLEDVALKKVELHIALGEIEVARKALESIGAVKEPLRSRFHRARAKLFLEKGGDPKAALDAAETAASLDPRSVGALSLLARAHLANGQLDRALAFATQLVERRPTEIDAFAILASIAEAKHDGGKARAHRLRSQAFRDERARADGEVKRREGVLRAVRDAERGLGIAGLAAVRAEEPMLGLPVDLATAKSGTAGFKRQARERILSACRGELALFLQRATGWDHLTLTSSLYGVAETADVPLSAADPGRCSEAPQKTRAPKKK